MFIAGNGALDAANSRSQDGAPAAPAAEADVHFCSQACFNSSRLDQEIEIGHASSTSRHCSMPLHRALRQLLHVKTGCQRRPLPCSTIASTFGSAMKPAGPR